MDKWRILGIDKTKDKGVIKNAYRDKLSLYNPEDDAEGFQRLRSSYEEAIKEADKEDEVIEDNSPIEVWIKKIEDNYNDFSSRVNEDNWRKILDDDVCFQLDSSEEASNRLLIFLMDKFYLSNTIIKIFNDCFNWADKEDELKQSFPEDFINFIMYKINGEDNIRYELFNVEEGKNYDEFIYLFNELFGHVNNYRQDEAREVIEKIDKLDIQHVDMTMLYARYYLDNEEVDKAERLINEALLECKDYRSYYIAAQVEFALGKGHIEKAKEYYEETLQQNEGSIGCIKGIADCLSELGEYEKANEKYNEVLKAAPFNDVIIGCKRNNDLKLIEKYKHDLEIEESNKIKFELAWIQVEAYEFKEAMKTAEKIEPSEEDTAQYYNLLGVINERLENYEKALSSFRKYKEVNTDESKDSYIYAQIGCQLEFLDKLEEALEMYDKAIELDNTDQIVKYRKCKTLGKLNKLVEAVDLCNNILEEDNRDARVYYCKGECLYKLGEYREAIESLDNCMNIYPYFVESYIIEIKIYCEVSQYEDAMYLINKVEEYKIENREISIYKAKVLRLMEKYEECKALCQKLLKEEVNNSDVYYELALVSKCELEFIGALKYIDMAISEDEKNINNFYLRMEINKNLKQYEDALIDADTIISLDSSDHHIYRMKAIIYEEIKNYQKCIECYIKALEIDPTNDEYYNLLGIAYEYDGKDNEAFRAYRKAIKLNPSQNYAYRNLADIYGKQKDFRKRIEFLKKQTEFNNNYEYFYNEIASAYAYDLEDYVMAIEYYSKTLNLNSENGDAHVNIAYCYSVVEDYEKSKQHFERSLEISGDSEYVCFCLGEMYANRFDNYEKAIENYEKVAYLNSSIEDIFIKLGDCHKYLGNYNEALMYYNKQKDVSGQTGFIYNSIGLLYEMNLEDYMSAIENYKKAIKINPCHPNAYRNIADCFKKSGYDNSEAIKYYKKQGKVSGDKRMLYKEIAEIYEEMGKMIRAKRYYKKAIEYYIDVVKNNETHACNYNKLGKCYTKVGEDDKAMTSFLRAITLEQSSSDCEECECHSSHYEICILYLKQDKLKQALEHLNKAIEIKEEQKYIDEKKIILKVLEG